jgi:hypothetical protein
MATATKQKMVTAVFRDRPNAIRALEWLLAHGYTNREINLLMSEATKKNLYAHQKEGHEKAGTHALEGMATGGAIGTAVGATAAAIAAIGTSLVIPGLGLVIAGPLAAALAGAGAGAVTGGAIGGLVGLGIPEANAHAYEQALREGGIAIGVVPHSREDESRIEKLFTDLQGENVITAN